MLNVCNYSKITSLKQASKSSQIPIGKNTSLCSPKSYRSCSASDKDAMQSQLEYLTNLSKKKLVQEILSKDLELQTIAGALREFTGYLPGSRKYLDRIIDKVRSHNILTSDSNTRVKSIKQEEPMLF